ncbi:MAG: histidine kinase dimerization/phospho-acceptor domain-containing protein, partial [Eubacteriales bacterium]|nr:histidine kinase dimerization/phospho-acceptor domain-containing protein [Eubacteriales bacterium]
MRHKIAFRLLASFAAALLFFAVVSSLLFRSLFTNAVVEAKRKELLSRAASFSDMLSSALDQTRQVGFMGGGQGGSYTNFVRLLSEAYPNLWVLDENLSFLSAGHMMGRTLDYETLPPEAEQLVTEVFQGQTSFSEGFSDLAGVPMLTVGAPIYREGQVVGALLLNDAVSGTEEATHQAQRILLISAGAALMLSTILAAILSLSFTKPISRMKATAQLLSDSDYSAKTGLTRQDEIGQLAKSIDTLSVRLEEAQAASRQQEQLRRDFLANVSHELRTPVTVLKGSLEAMRDGVVSEPEKIMEYVHQMLSETEGLHRLVNDLMELARLQNTDFPIESEPLSLQDVLLDALRGADRLARDKKITIHRQVTGQPVRIQGDYARLKQMLLIVLDNAVKFSPASGTVKAEMNEHSI